MSIVARYELSIVEIVPLKLHLSVILILSDCRAAATTADDLSPAHVAFGWL